ncbi:MAG: hypothetical protein O9324_15660 [Microcystis sp. LE19-84.1B]|jgi:hypothetical protein|nr:hypothetical protein [Microcystis sp. LE19-84.1B]
MEPITVATIVALVFQTTVEKFTEAALEKMAQLELRGKRYNRDTELEVRPWTGTLTVCLNYRT